MKSLKYESAYVEMLIIIRIKEAQHARVTYAFIKKQQSVCRNQIGSLILES